MNYLDLCKDLVKEIGIAGGTGPSSVSNQTGELANVVRWIRDSHTWIGNLWRDWNFLWGEHTQTISTIYPIPPTGITVRTWNRDAVWTDYGTSKARQLAFEEWEVFRGSLAGGWLPGAPSVFSIKPDGTLILNRAPTVTTTLRTEYWRAPKTLTYDDDLPDLPDAYHRLIVCRAAIMYGNREAAPEIISGMEAEYLDLKEKLESDQLEAFRFDRMAGQDQALVMEIP